MTKEGGGIAEVSVVGVISDVIVESREVFYKLVFYRFMSVSVYL